MIIFSFFHQEDLMQDGIKEFIISSIDLLWVSLSFHLLIETFYDRDDLIRSVQVFQVKPDSYRMEILKYWGSEKKEHRNLFVRTDMEKYEVLQVVKQVLYGTIEELDPELWKDETETLKRS